MATNTTNFNLIKPAYTDTADIADINGNMDKVDVSLNGLADAIAIVANNNTHAAITAGQYVYVHGHGSLAEGLYTAKSNIAANATLSISNLQADGSGGLNALNSKTSYTSSSNAISAGSKFTLDTANCYKFGYLTVLAFTVIASSTYGTSDSLITGIPSSFRPAVNISCIWSQLVRNGNTYNYISNAAVRMDGTSRQTFTSNGQSGDTISAVFIFPNE